MGFRLVNEPGAAHARSNACYIWAADAETDGTPVMDAGALRQRLNAVLQAALCERHKAEEEYQVMRLRFGLDDGTWHTLEAIARQIGTTRDRVRKVLSYALLHLRSEEDALQDLADYLRLASAPHRVAASIAWLLPARDDAGEHRDTL